MVVGAHRKTSEAADASHISVTTASADCLGSYLFEHGMDDGNCERVVDDNDGESAPPR